MATALVGVLGIVLGAAATAEATFPGANGRIAYQAQMEVCCDDPQGFNTMNPDGSGVSLIAVGLPGVQNVTYSPDGRRVAFTALSGPVRPEWDGDTSYVREVYTAGADGSRVRRVTSNRTGESALAWSPDGKWLSLVNSTPPWDSRVDLAVVSAEGGELLTLGPADTLWTAWTADGDAIMYSGYGDDGRGEIRSVPAQGGQPKVLASAAGSIGIGSPSPAGDEIVFDLCAGSHCDLMKARTDGTGVTPLLYHLGADDYIDRPTWSPDGSTIVFCRSLHGEEGFWAIDADGSDVRLVLDQAQGAVDEPGCGQWRSWQPLPASPPPPPGPGPPGGGPPAAPPGGPPATGAPCSAELMGTAGPDRLVGGRDGDRLVGLGANDRLFGGLGADCLLGGAGDDRLDGGAGDDRLDGGPGADLVSGGIGSDVLDGAAGRDRLDGGPGSDVLRPGSAYDVVRGGAGDDKIDARGSEIDLVDCGAGRDLARVSASDRVRNCERVVLATASR
jgi:hypothetical protein